MSVRTMLVGIALAGAFAARPLSAQESLPQSLAGLEPHQVVQAILSDAGVIGLTNAQIGRLDSLHVAVRDEPHTYTDRSAPGKAHRTKLMDPMISKQQAYNDALSLLTLEQRDTAIRRFNAPGYEPTFSP